MIQNIISSLVLSVINIPGNSLSPETLNRKPDPVPVMPVEETIDGPCRIIHIENRAAGSLYECQIYTSPLGN